MNDQAIEQGINKLKTLAVEVMQWSNCNKAWLDQSKDEPDAVVGHIDDDGNCYPVATIDCDQYYAGQDSMKLARFYAAANPETVLRMIAMIDDAQKLLVREQLIVLDELNSRETKCLKKQYFYLTNDAHCCGLVDR